MTEVIATQRALRDIAKIDAYSIQTFGQGVADKYQSDIDRAAEMLSENPGLLRHKPEVSGRMRFYRVREHFFVCDVIDERIYIVTVMHTTMDLPNRIAELEPELIQEVELLHLRYQAKQGRN